MADQFSTVGAYPMSGKSGAAKYLLASATGRRWQYAIAVVVLLAGTVLSVTVFGMLRARESRHIRRDLERTVQDRISALKRTLAFDVLEMKALGGFYAGSENVSRSEFKVFTAPLLENRSSIRAMQWVPRVRGADRSEFEKAAVREG